MRKFLLAVAALAVGLANASKAFADYRDGLVTDGTITIGTTGAFPPATMINDSGKLVGYDIDVMNAIGKELGLDVKFVTLDWAGLLPGLIAGRFDVIASLVTRTKERRDSSDFILLSPYTVDGVVIARRADDDSISGWDDICGKRLGVIRGSNVLDRIKGAISEDCLGSVTEYPGWTELSLDLKNGRIDWTGSQYIQSAFLQKENTGLTVLSEIRAPTTAGHVVSAKTPELAEAMDNLIAKFREDGTLDELSMKWFGTTFDWSQMPKEN